MGMLSSKERIRLKQVREQLANNQNPYSKLSTLTLGEVKVVKATKPSVKVKANTDEKRVSNHRWKFIEGEAEVKPVANACISCGSEVQVVNGIYGRVITQVITKAIDTINKHGEEIRKIIKFPMFTTGYACKPCFDRLYNDTYYDASGNLHRAMEIVHKTYVDRDVLKRQRVHRDDMNSPKDRVKRVTQIVLDHGEETDEEWVISPPKRVEEPVDVKAYSHFMRRGKK